ncbi:MAG: PhoH family protein [Deltaproteobacteria bacterium]|nr:PhoH family protein [Deltaproteobacteria bacterium]
MKKYFVLDTNVLLHDVNSLFAFQDNDVVIPIIAIEELDRFKKDLNEIGRNARQVSRILDKFRDQGQLFKGIKLENGGTLRVFIQSSKSNSLPPELIFNKADNQILSVAMELKEKGKQPVCLVTKDTNLRIKADALGISARDYESDKIEISEQYEGFRTTTVPRAVIDSFYAKGSLEPLVNDLFPNEGVLLVDEGDSKHSALARFHKEKGNLLPLTLPKEGVWGIYPKNAEQRFAMDLLLDDSIKLVTLAGKAGTGKTLVAIAAGLKKTADEETYTRLLVSRPIFPLGKDIGFLPGNLEEKLTPWMQPIFDNLELIFGLDRKDKEKGMHYNYKELMNQGILQLEPLTYIRGRSIPNQYMIVDEAQNLTPHEIKTIITRAGDNTKIVLTGDPYQIDNPYIDSSSNGLSYVVERFKNEAIAGHVTLSKGERSELAERAANLL